MTKQSCFYHSLFHLYSQTIQHNQWCRKLGCLSPRCHLLRPKTTASVTSSRALTVELAVLFGLAWWQWSQQSRHSMGRGLLATGFKTQTCQQTTDTNIQYRWHVGGKWIYICISKKEITTNITAQKCRGSWGNPDPVRFFILVHAVRSYVI